MESEIYRPEERRRSGHQMLDVVTSICALGISFVSIYMAYDNGRDMQKLVHANSWPVLQLGSGNAPDDGHMLQIGFHLRNAGIGPARIHTFEFLVDKAPLNRGGYLLREIVEACCAKALKEALAKAGGDELAALGIESTSPIANTFLSPNEERRALGWPRTEANAAVWDVVDDARKHGRIQMRACYCSVFDECWVVEPNVFPPREVASCSEKGKH
jgi:hypothetical protein